jgi:glycosyltransferase involved in cell wall biosynthesis
MADVFWNPYGGWGEPPQIEKVPHNQWAVVSFHGAAGLSKDLSRVYGREPTIEEFAFRDQQDALWRSALDRYDRIVVPSQYGKSELLSVFGISENRIRVSPLGVDHRRFRRGFWQRSGTGFLHVSAAGPVKNLDTLMEAYALLPTSRPPLTLIVPEHAHRSRIDGVRYLDVVDDWRKLRRLYSEAAVIIQPSLWETFGLTVLEAAACGVPAIVSTGSALEEYWQDASMFVHAEQTAEISAAMQRIIDDSRLRRTLARMAYARSKDFTWAGHAECLVQCFDQREVYRRT